MADLAASCASLGGVQYHSIDAIHIEDGKLGIDLNFTANFSADVRLRSVGEGTWDLVTVINLTPNGLFWAGVVGGFCTGALWIIPILYFVIDPQRAYIQAIDRVIYGGSLPVGY